MKLSKGQAVVLALAATPMAAVGVAGAVATYVNMNNVLHRSASALGLVAAGEGAVLIASLVALAVTLMGQHTPGVVRAAMWLVPLAASGVGMALAPSRSEAVVMGFTPMAMTAAGEGVAFVARRVVAYRTGTDIEQQRRSGLLLWHANRAANGKGLGRRISRMAVWRLTKGFAATDMQLSVQLGEIQRFRISQGADANLAAVLTNPENGAQASVSGVLAPPRALTPAKAEEVISGPYTASVPIVVDANPIDAHFAEVAEVLAGAEEAVNADPSVPLLTTSEVAKLKGVNPGTVRSWKHRGKLVPAAVVDGVPMYRQTDVMALD